MLFSVMLFSKISAKEIIFVLCSIVLVCNMTFVKSSIDVIELMYYEILYTHVALLYLLR